MTRQDINPTRIAREQESRETVQREPATFIPAGLVPELQNKNPDYVYRWVRSSNRGQLDTGNVSARMQEGWVPVSWEEMPEIIKMPDLSTKFPEMIERRGMLLMKIAKEKSKARQDYFKKLNRSQMESVDNNFMRENDRRMPLFRERTSATKSFM